MSNENSLPDIPDRQLLTGSPQPASVWTDIGEAQITHSIFGRAKVRIIRKHDNLHRALWLVAMAAIAVTAWQGWIAFHPADSSQSADSLPHERAEEHEAAPDFRPETTPVPAPQQAVESKPVTPQQTAIDKPEIIPVSAPQAAQNLKASEPVPAKPLAPKPLIVRKPQPAPVATGNPSMEQTDKPQPTGRIPPKQLPSKQPGTPFVEAPRVALPATPSGSAVPVAAPRTLQRATQPAASSPAAVAPLSAPVLRQQAPPSAGNAQQPAQPASPGY